MGKIQIDMTHSEIDPGAIYQFRLTARSKLTWLRTLLLAILALMNGDTV